MSTKLVLCGLAAGYCEYDGCDKRLTGDALTGAVFSSGFVAHNIAKEPGGPRGDPVLSKKLADDIDNLLWLCATHHKLVDVEDPDGHPPELLRRMKRDHESRIEIACGIPSDKKSHILLYGANVGDHRTALDYRTAAPALMPHRYPAGSPLVIQTKDSYRRDGDPRFWSEEKDHLIGKFEARVRPVLADGDDPHVSVFGLAPQPLLVLLGSLLTDISRVDVYQRHREPEPSWSWPDHGNAATPLELTLTPPETVTGTPALILALSADVTLDRVEKAMAGAPAVWKITTPTPSQDCIRSPEDLSALRTVFRKALNEIKLVHGEEMELHVFPAVPVSAAVEFGRVRQPKADLPYIIYDQISGQGFIPAVRIGMETSL